MIGLVPTLKAQNDMRRADFSNAEIEVNRYGFDNLHMQNIRKRSSFPNDTSDASNSIKDQINKPQKDSGFGQFTNNQQIAVKTKRRGHKDTEQKQKQEQTIGNQLKRLKLISLKSKIRKLDAACAFFGFLGVFLQIIELEIYFGNQTQNQNARLNASNQILRIISSLTTIILLILNTYFYYKQYCYKRLRGFQISLGETFLSSREFKFMIATNFVNIFHCPPYLDFDFVQKNTYHIYRQNISIILSNVMILRFYLIIRLITNLSQWKNIHSEECCEREGFEANLPFAIKSLLKEKPFQMLAINFLISILAFGFSVRSFERAYYEDIEFKEFNGDNVPYQNYNYVWNSFWLVVVTMTTVGFGDFYPVTDGGRLVIVISCFWGIFMVSQFVYTLQVRSEFTLAEQKAFELLRRLIQKQELKKEAASLIIAWWRARKFKKLQQSESLNKSDLIKYATMIGKKKKSTQNSFNNIISFAQDVFVKRLGQFSKERQRIQKQGIPLSENLQKINKLIENHLKELNNAMMTFREMRKNIEKLTSEIERDNQSIDNIQINLQNLDYVLNKIVYLKSHAVNMMFKDAVVLKKEELDQATIFQGMGCLKQLMTSALSMIMKETQQKLFGLEWNQRDFMQKLNFNEMIQQQMMQGQTLESFQHKNQPQVQSPIAFQQQPQKFQNEFTPKNNLFVNPINNRNLRSQLSDFHFTSPINPFNFTNSRTKVMINNTPQLYAGMISPSQDQDNSFISSEEQKEIPSNHQHQQQQQILPPPTPTPLLQSIPFESPYEIRQRQEGDGDDSNKHNMILDDAQAIQNKIQNRKLQLIKNEIEDVKQQKNHINNTVMKDDIEMKEGNLTKKIQEFTPVNLPDNIHDKDLWGNQEAYNNSGSRKQSSLEQGVSNDIIKTINNIQRRASKSRQKIDLNKLTNQYSKKDSPITSIIQEALRMSIQISSEGRVEDLDLDQQQQLLNSHHNNQQSYQQLLLQKQLQLQSQSQLSQTSSQQSSQFTGNKTDKQIDIFQTIENTNKQYSMQQQQLSPLKHSTLQQIANNNQLIFNNQEGINNQEEQKEVILIKERLEKSGQWMTQNLPSFFDEAMLNMVKMNQQYSKKHSITKTEARQIYQ